MSSEDQRNTLIVELTAYSNQSNYQSFDDATLAGMGAVLVFLRGAGIRDDDGLKAMSADDQRNTLIVEIGAQNPHMADRLQGFSSMDLVLLGLGGDEPGASLHQPTYLRGVLLVGKFRTQYELNKLSADDQRNTLIVELTAHSNQSNYQSYDDYTLAGMGAVMVFLREAGIRDDATLETMSADDQRNTLIAEIGAQTGLGSRLQGLHNMDLVRLALGADPATMFQTLPPPLLQLSRMRLQFRLRDFIVFRSGDDLFQGARDEVYISALAMDSSRTYIKADGTVMTDKIESHVIGDVAKDEVKGPWHEHPHVLVEFDLDHLGPVVEFQFDPPDGPKVHRVFTVTLLVVEEDNADVAETFDAFKQGIQKKVDEVVKAAASSTIGSAVGGALGAAAGAGVGAVAGLALAEIFSAISDGLDNEVFSPKTLKLVLVHAISNLMPEENDRTDWFEIKEHGSLYRIYYDWHIETGG
jgi:hypothetical protein